MKKKQLIIFGALVLVLILFIFIVRFVFGGAEDAWICSEKGWVMHGHPKAPIPTGVCSLQNDRE